MKNKKINWITVLAFTTVVLSYIGDNLKEKQNEEMIKEEIENQVQAALAKRDEEDSN